MITVLGRKVALSAMGNEINGLECTWQKRGEDMAEKADDILRILCGDFVGNLRSEIITRSQVLICHICDCVLILPISNILKQLSRN